MYQQHLDFVEQTLIKNHGILSHRPEERFRSRFSHTVRVMKWTELLSQPWDVNKEVLALSAIFHDVGYNSESSKQLHSARSAEIFRDYAATCKDISPEIIESVYFNIFHHSEKQLLGTDIPIELTLLLEADSIDEEGPVRILRDCLILGQDPESNYEAVYYRMMQYRMAPCPLVTPLAKQYWQERLNLSETFLSLLKQDLFLE